MPYKQGWETLVILCKDKTFSEILKIFQNKYIEIRKMLDCNLLSKN